MPKPATEALATALAGRLLGTQGNQIRKGLWENCVYYARDGFVYHVTATRQGKGPQVKIAGKRTVGEYLRWVDGLFAPGQLPDEKNAVHFRAARALREML